MKSICITLILIICSLSDLWSSNCYLTPNPPPITVSTNFSKLQDGWYSATVKYYNYNTGTRSTYSLDVKVEYDRVVKIDFGNGGSVHSGYNDSGYTYSGGYLSEKTDYYNNVVGYTTKVTIYESNSNTVTFDITIE